MLTALHGGVKGNKWFSLIDKVYADRTLERAWEKVQANAGACGVDGITVGHFAKDTRNRLLAVKEHLKEGTYQPKPAKRVWIPKPGSAEKRPLGIPAVTDRVVQAALKMVIEPIFEREFCPQSYGFRPGRSCRDALRRVDELLKRGRVHVVDIDIKGYFDAIPHERLMAQVEEHVADGRVVKLIEACLKQGVMEGMESWETEEGTPQGGVISPLLANIYLNPLDWLMVQAGLDMVRYADDMVILCPDRATAEAALSQVRSWMEAAGLELHPEKTKIVDLTQEGSFFDFLGYRFWRGKRGNILRLIRPKSRMKLRDRLKPLTRRANGHSLEAIVQKLNPILRGYYGYFKHASATALEDVDRWVRGRLRSMLRKRMKRDGRARGHDHQRWKNCYFAELGLFSLKQTQAEAIVSLRNGVTR
jgi:RNA-directed DNA polymerase